MEAAARGAAQQAVAEVAALLIGNKKADLPPVFAVTLVLEKNNRIELKPTVQVWKAPSGVFT